MTRPTALLSKLSLAGALLLGLPASAASKPDILFIAVDDLNDWISPVGGHPQTVTPNFECLAKRSVPFTNDHCIAPACGPVQPVGLLDLYPTLMELCGLQGPKLLDGASLVPLLRKPDTVTERKLLTCFDPGNVSIRTTRWRYIRYADGSEELYDKKTDPNEWHNLARKAKDQEPLDSFRKLARTAEADRSSAGE